MVYAGADNPAYPGAALSIPLQLCTPYLLNPFLARHIVWLLWCTLRFPLMLVFQMVLLAPTYISKD